MREVPSQSCSFRTGWFTTLIGTKLPIEPPLREDLKWDVLIVGGGASGLAAAARFACTGKKVPLLEKNI